MGTDFNAKAARSKRPCPLWVDAFQRDTQHLGADEVGAYILILMAMWTRESCDFPDDDRRLSRVSRVSLRLWKARIGPAIRQLLLAADGVVVSKRLREEAAYVEREVQAQSDRKRGTYGKPAGSDNAAENHGEKSRNALINNNPYQSADSTTDATVDGPWNYPSQQPNNPTLIGGGGNARGGFSDQNLDRILAAAFGHIPEHPPQSALIEIGRWTRAGLAAVEIEAEINAVMAERNGSHPKSMRYFRPAMLRLIADKADTLPPQQPQAERMPRASPQKQLWKLDPSKFNDDGSLK